MKEKYNILFIITKSSVGGAQKFVAEQIQICAASGLFDCYLATSGDDWIQSQIGHLLHGNLIDTGILSSKNIGYVFRLRKYIKENAIDVVICNSSNGGLYGRLSAYLSGVASVYVTHGWGSIYNGGRVEYILNFVEKLLSYIGTRVLCISKGDYINAINKININPKRLVHLDNAILPSKISDIRNYQSQSVFTLSRLSPPKRVDLILETAALTPHIQYYIFGEGEQRENLVHKMNTMKLTNVHFEGEVQQFDRYKDFDVFILLSDSEGLPMSALEAMAQSRPLILSRVGGCPDLILDNGYVVDNEVNVIVDAVNSCMKYKSNFSQASQKLYDHKYNLSNRKQEFIQLYISVIKTKN